MRPLSSSSFFEKKTSHQDRERTIAKPTDPGAWKARLAEQLPPLHDRSPFDQLISDYLTEDQKPDLSFLVCECMKHGNVDVLAYILANEDIKSLCIDGPINQRGWKTLIKAMPDNLMVEDLRLSGVGLNLSKIKLLYQAMSEMPALKSLELWGVHIKPSTQLNQWQGSPLPFDKLKVTAVANPKFGVYVLLKKLFGSCKLRDVSIHAGTEINTHQHARLAELLGGQTRLESLRLEIDERNTPEEFECYMPLLCGEKAQPLVHLELSSCTIGVANFNWLIKALPQNNPALQSLILTECVMKGNVKHGAMGKINFVPLAGMKSLTHLDLSKNYLPVSTTLALLKAVTEKPTPLVVLNLSKNFIGADTISAIASLLRKSETLRSISFEPSALATDLGGSDEMLELVEAVKHNKSLMDLQFRWPLDLDEYRASVHESLGRNRQAFMQAAMQTAAAFVMPQLLNAPWREEILPTPQLPKLPGDMIQHIIGQGLTVPDALTLTSLNHKTRAAHEEFLRKTGS